MTQRGPINITAELDVTIASGSRKINDIAGLSLFFGVIEVWDRKYLTIQRGFCMGCTD
jgi:hypothetical protein